MSLCTGFATSTRIAPPALTKCKRFGGCVAQQPSAAAVLAAPRLTVAHAAEVAPAASEPASDLRRYETLIVLKPTLTDEERDQELARFETFLIQEQCEEVKAIIRGRHRMAYHIKGNWEGIYVLFSFLAKPSTSPKVQILLSNPPAGSEDNILRHMTFRY